MGVAVIDAPSGAFMTSFPDSTSDLSVFIATADETPTPPDGSMVNRTMILPAMASNTMSHYNPFSSLPSLFIKTLLQYELAINVCNVLLKNNYRSN